MKKWKELMDQDLMMKDLTVDAAQDRVKWKRLIRNSYPDLSGKNAEAGKD